VGDGLTTGAELLAAGAVAAPAGLLAAGAVVLLPEPPHATAIPATAVMTTARADLTSRLDGILPANMPMFSR